MAGNPYMKDRWHESDTVIYKNMIRCNHCYDIIESKHRHDYVTCKCGKVSADGGKDYFKRTFDKPDDYIEIFELIDVKK